jgi:hypothetical protein
MKGPSMFNKFRTQPGFRMEAATAILHGSGAARKPAHTRGFRWIAWRAILAAAATALGAQDLSQAQPVILVQPLDQTVSAGGTASFSVVATGIPPLYYQWRKDRADILGETATSLSFTATAADNGTLYSVVVMDAAGTVWSREATLTVISTPPTCTITTSAAPLVAGTSTGGGTYSSGDGVTVVATANAGFVFVNWTEGGVEVSTSASYGFTAGANRTLVANFTRAYTITTTAAPPVGGTTTGGGIYRSGDSVTVVATANAGFVFVNWTEGGVELSATATYSFVAAANRTLVAHFTRANVPPTVVLTSPAAGATYPAPADVSLSANASDRDGSIVKVEFFINGVLFGTVTSAPYSLAWSGVPCGTYALKARTTDDDLAIATSATVTITVQDVTPPTLSCPPSITALATTPDGANVSFIATATDICDPSPAVSCTPSSGSLFPVGTTTVLCTATDAAGNSGTCSFPVIVKDIVAVPGPGGLTIAWAVPGAALESAPSVTGPWSEVSGAISPYTVLAAGEGTFYRLRMP